MFQFVLILLDLVNYGRFMAGHLVWRGSRVWDKKVEKLGIWHHFSVHSKLEKLESSPLPIYGEALHPPYLLLYELSSFFINQRVSSPSLFSSCFMFSLLNSLCVKCVWVAKLTIEACGLFIKLYHGLDEVHQCLNAWESMCMNSNACKVSIKACQCVCMKVMKK